MIFAVFDMGGGRRRSSPQLPPIPVKGILIGVCVLLLLAVAWTAQFTVAANEEGLVTRFGKYVRKVPPGLHFKLPLGIERVYLVKTAFTFKEEFGFRTVGTGQRPQYAPQSPRLLGESLMVTGDRNMAQVEWTVQYRIKDSFSFLFRIQDPTVTLRDVSESIMREVVGDMSVSEVLTEKRVEINHQVRTKLQEALDSYDAGIAVTQVILQDVNPPEKVKPAFDDVNMAQQERETTINAARQAYNRAIPLAEGEALRQVEEAEGYALNRVNRARGEVARFSALLEEYSKAPEVTRTRIYLEHMGKIVPSLKRRIVIDEAAGNVLPLLDLNREARQP